MIINKFDIVLERLNEDARLWRNLDFVRAQMMYTSIITEEEHDDWFAKINNDQNFYFIAKENDNPIAIVNLKNVENNCAEAGIFLISEGNKKSMVVAKVAMALVDFGFLDLNLDYLYSRVKYANKSAIALNSKFGALAVPEKSNPEFIFFVFERDRYFSTTDMMRLRFTRLRDNKDHLDLP